MQKIILWALAVVIIAGGWYLYSAKGSAQAPSESSETPAQETADTDADAQVGVPPVVPAAKPNTEAAATPPAGALAQVIAYTDAGFSPSSVTIKKGQTIRWTDNSVSNVWPASAVHPEHGAYPQKSSSDCLGSSFDACRGLSQGESWDFTFDHAGNWKFHNHLKASQTGVVNVTE